MPYKKGSDPESAVSAPDVGSSNEGVPRHVAVIMDGNNRWAKRRGLPSLEGHRAGANALRQLVEGCVRAGVKVLTVFAFSSENWRRPPGEVNALLELFVQALGEEVPSLDENDISVRFIGRLEAFELGLQRSMNHAMQVTKDNQRLVLNVAVNYGGRWDIAHAAQRLAMSVKSGELTPDMIDERLFSSCLTLAGLPDVDLCIRTGGEYRLSNFLLWQVAYAELYFSKLLWPDFDDQAFQAVLSDYSMRQRRFGRTQEQVQRLSKEERSATRHTERLVEANPGDSMC